MMADKKGGAKTAQKPPLPPPSEGYNNGPGEAESMMIEDFGNVRPFTPQDESKPAD